MHRTPRWWHIATLWAALLQIRGTDASRLWENPHNPGNHLLEAAAKAGTPGPALPQMDDSMSVPAELRKEATMDTEPSNDGEPLHGGALCVASLQAPEKTYDIEDYKTPPGFSPLDAPKLDAEAVCGVMEKKGLPSKVVVGYAQDGPVVSNYDPLKPILTRASVLGALREMFQEERLEMDPFFLFFFSGHGNKGFFANGTGVESSQKKYANELPYLAEQTIGERDHRGALVVQASDGDPPSLVLADYIFFSDILEVWRQEKEFLSKGARFVVLADACYSGKLVSQLRALCSVDCEGLNMAVQSAGDECQYVLERTTRRQGKQQRMGGLAGWWVAKNSPDQADVRWSSARSYEQYPQYFASWNQKEYKQGPVRDLAANVPGGLYFMQRWRTVEPESELEPEKKRRRKSPEQAPSGG